MVVSADNAWPWTLLSNRFRTNFRFEFSHNSAITNFLIFSYRPPRSSQNVHDYSSSVDRGEEEATRKGRNVVRKQKQKNLHNVKQRYLWKRKRGTFFSAIENWFEASYGRRKGRRSVSIWMIHGGSLATTPAIFQPPWLIPPLPTEGHERPKEDLAFRGGFFRNKKIHRSQSFERDFWNENLPPSPPFFFLHRPCTTAKISSRDRSRFFGRRYNRFLGQIRGGTRV